MSQFIFLLVIASALLHASWNLFAKKTPADKITFIVVGELFASLLILPMTIAAGDLNHFQATWIPFIFWTSFFHGIYLLALGYSYSLGDFSVIYPIARGSGIAGTVFLNWAFQIETISFKGWLGIFMILAGLCLMGIFALKQKNQYRVFFAALFVGLNIAGYSVVDNLAVQHIPTFFYGCIMCLIGPLLILPYLFFKKRSSLQSVLKQYKRSSFLVGSMGILTYLLILFAFQYSPGSYVVALRETSVVFAVFMGWIFLKESMNPIKIVGVIFIACGAIFIRLA